VSERPLICPCLGPECCTQLHVKCVKGVRGVCAWVGGLAKHYKTISVQTKGGGPVEGVCYINESGVRCENALPDEIPSRWHPQSPYLGEPEESLIDSDPGLMALIDPVAATSPFILNRDLTLLEGLLGNFGGKYPDDLSLSTLVEYFT
jgi:hypothetical protein